MTRRTLGYHSFKLMNNDPSQLKSWCPFLVNYKAIHHSADNKEEKYILIQNEPEGRRMSVEMNKASSVRLTPVQELKLAKPATELYVGQILKTVVVTALTNDQVLININGQNLNAKSSHHYAPGELLEVKVTSTKEETVLEVQSSKGQSLSVLQNALLLYLPKQAPPINLLNTLHLLVKSDQLPAPVVQKIKVVLKSIISVPQLPQKLLQAIMQCGLFFESSLFNGQRGINPHGLKADFKGQCLRLLRSLPVTGKLNADLLPNAEVPHLEEDPLPLPGAVPQPLHRDKLICRPEQSPDELISILREQLIQVLARITASQINHLIVTNKEGYQIMLDLPIHADQQIDVIPLMIKQHKAEPMQPAKWSISFALSLTQLGDMQARVSLYSNMLDIKINAQELKTIDILNAYQDEISKLLGDLGLNLHQWKIQHGLEQNHIDVANLRLLDIRI